MCLFTALVAIAATTGLERPLQVTEIDEGVSEAWGLQLFREYENNFGSLFWQSLTTLVFLQLSLLLSFEGYFSR